MLIRSAGNLDFVDIMQSSDHSNVTPTEYSSKITDHLEGGSMHNPTVLGHT